MNAAYLQARRSGLAAVPMLSISLQGKHALDLGFRRWAPESIALPSGGSIGLVPPGGFERITFGCGIKQNVLGTVETSVRVNDPLNLLRLQLDAYDPRGSAAAIDWVVPDLVDNDWERIFTGILADWTFKGDDVDLRLKTDEASLQAAVPKPIFNKSVWGTATDPSIWATSQPLVMGIHDNFAVTARGMLTAINVRYDDNLGHWWCGSLGRLRLVKRVYFDGTEQPETSVWTTRRGVYGGVMQTFIVVTSAFRPDKDAVVTFDCEGPSDDGDEAGPALLNPILQLRTVLEQYVFRDRPAQLWDLTPISLIDDTSWDAAANYFDLFEYESAIRIGGDRDRPTGMDVVQSFLDSYPWVRIFWLPSGALGICIINPNDADPSSDWVRVDVTTKPEDFVYEPGDRKEIFTHVEHPYMYSVAEQKFMAMIEAHDVAAAAEKLKVSIANRWSQGRFTNF